MEVFEVSHDFLTVPSLKLLRLVGGSTRICAVQELVREMVGGKELNQSVSWTADSFTLRFSKIGSMEWKKR